MRKHALLLITIAIVMGLFISAFHLAAARAQERVNKARAERQHRMDKQINDLSFLKKKKGGKAIETNDMGVA